MGDLHEQSTWRGWTLLALRLILGVIMLFASFPKFFNWDGASWSNPVPPIDLAPFARDVYNYRILPIPLVNLVAMFVPAIEGLCSICLLTGAWLRPCTLIQAFFQMVFLVAMGQAMIRGLDINCGCFSGVADSKVGFFTLARDSVFLIGFISVFVLAKEKVSVGEEAPSVVSQEQDNNVSSSRQKQNVPAPDEGWR